MLIRTILVGLFLATVGYCVYHSVANYGYVQYDDFAYVGENKMVQSGWTSDSLNWAWTTNEQANWHPLTWMSHMFDCQVFGNEKPGYFHLVNVGLHIINSWLLFLVLQQMTNTFWRALLVATLFAVHPLHVESVAWISERKDVLSTLFWLGSILSYVAYVQYHKRFYYGISCLLLAAGLISKPMLVTAPFLLLLLDYWPLRRFSLGTILPNHRDKANGQEPTSLSSGLSGNDKKRNKRSSRQKRKRNRTIPVLSRSVAKADANTVPVSLGWLAVEKLPMLLLVLLSSWVTYFVQKGGGAVGSVPLDHRFATIVLAYVRYLSKTCWPTNLAVLYPNYPGMWSAVQTASALGLLVTLTVAVYAWQRRRYLTVGWLWFLGTLVPVIGVVQIGEHSMADRYMYVPIVGLFICIAWGLDEIVQRTFLSKAVGTMIAVIGCIVFSLVARQQVSVWENSESLFRHAVNVTENNYSMHDKLADELRRQGRTQEAIEHYKQAIDKKPDFSEAHSDLGVMYQDRGEFQKAIAHYQQAIQADSQFIEAYTNFGVALNALNRTAEAIRTLQRGLDLQPDHPETLFNLGVIYQQQKRNQQAIVQYRLAIAADPNYPAAYNNLGVALQHNKQFDTAIEMFFKALEVDPQHCDAHFNLANGYRSRQEFKKAIDHYRQAIAITPPNKSFRARVNLAITLQETKRWQEANELILQSLPLFSGNQKQRLEILQQQIPRL